jgi:uncharacterized SAM-binding protein YcdF (DUF218 family)
MDPLRDGDTGRSAEAGGVRRLARLLAWGLALAAVAVAAGFWVFRGIALHSTDPVGAGADGIVALTGGTARIDSAVALLEEGRARRLLITGVHPQTSQRQLVQLTGGAAALFDCCIDIDRSALDTRGNAEEAKRWADAHGFRRLLVVTSDYHMPRALLEFSRRMPGVTLLPHPVPAAETGLGAVRLWLSEYAKYLLALVRPPAAGGAP